MTLAELEAFSRQANERLDAIKNFKSTYSPDDRRIYFNDNTKQFIVAPKSKFSYKPKDYLLFNYDQIVDFELLKDGSSIASGGLGRTAVGGLLFGGVGAIVGASTGRKKGKRRLQ